MKQSSDYAKFIGFFLPLCGFIHFCMENWSVRQQMPFAFYIALVGVSAAVGAAALFLTYCRIVQHASPQLVIDRIVENVFFKCQLELAWVIRELEDESGDDDLEACNEHLTIIQFYASNCRERFDRDKRLLEQLYPRANSDTIEDFILTKKHTLDLIESARDTMSDASKSGVKTACKVAISAALNSLRDAEVFVRSKRDSVFP